MFGLGTRAPSLGAKLLVEYGLGKELRWSFCFDELDVVPNCE